MPKTTTVARGRCTSDPIPVADVEPHEGEELGRRGVELAGRAVVAVPVQNQVGGEDAAARHQGDVGHPGEDAAIAEPPDQAEVIQARPEAIAGEGQSDPIRAAAILNGARDRSPRPGRGRYP
jgi:hypothetical protein